jgi:hypothetical protein
MIYEYYGKAGKYLKALTLPFTTPYTHPRAINSSNVVAGFFRNSRSSDSGFLFSKGIATVIDYPSSKATITYLGVINDKGIVTGVRGDSKGNYHDFLLDTKSVPNSTSSGVGGINTGGLVLVSASDGTNYIYCSKPKTDCPSGGIEVVDEPIRVPPGSFPRYDCAHDCISLRVPTNQPRYTLPLAQTREPHYPWSIMLP